VEVNGIARVAGEMVFVLRMLQGRNPDRAYRPFFARYCPKATWMDELKPAFGEKRIFHEEDPEWGPLLQYHTADDDSF
jgi:hypothetical protein